MGVGCGKEGLEELYDHPTSPKTPTGKGARSTNRHIDSYLSKESRAEAGFIKVLLLGTGESGKSTILKQARKVYGSGFPADERLAYRVVIYSNVLEGVRALIHAFWPRNRVRAKEMVKDLPFAEEEKLCKTTNPTDFNASTAAVIAKLWANPQIKEVFADRNANFYIQDSLSYFLDKLAEIAKPDYVPSFEDVLYSRRRTTGIVELDFIYAPSGRMTDTRIKMIDVGGQRTERRKWIHQFSKCQAVIYVAALSDYNHILYDDAGCNPLMESVLVFQEIVNLDVFSKTNFIVFLNKRDLLKEHLRKRDFAAVFSEYKSDVIWSPKLSEEALETEVENVIGFVRSLYMSRVEKFDPSRVYFHVTIATETKIIASILSDIWNSLQTNMAKSSGFLE